MPTQVIATCFALASFVAAAILGVVAGNPIVTILWRATVIMAAAWFVGLAIGAIAQRAVDEHLRQTDAADPAASDDQAPTASSNADHAPSTFAVNAEPALDDTDQSNASPNDPTASVADGGPRREAA